MTLYAGSIASLYDLFYDSKPYQAEVAQVETLLLDHGVTREEPLLDLACGTGRHSIGLAQLGWNVTGLDASDAMLEIARRRAETEDVRVTFEIQDMRSLSLKRKFGGALCLFDSLGYAVTDEGISSTLGGVRKHLNEGSPFIFQVWHAPAMLAGYEPVRLKRFNMPDGREVLRISETTVHPHRSTCKVRITVLEPKGDSLFQGYEEIHENRFFTRSEIEAFLADAGLEPVDIFGGTDGAPLAEDSWHMTGIARAT